MTFNEPFFGTGSTLSLSIGLRNGTVLSGNFVVPDITQAGNVIATFNSYGITLTTTGITNADRMSFGYAPGSFNPSGAYDTVFQLDFTTAGPSPVPEPASLLFLSTGALTGLGVIRRKLFNS